MSNLDALKAEIRAVLVTGPATYLRLEDVTNAWTEPQQLRQALNELVNTGEIDLFQHEPARFAFRLVVRPAVTYPFAEEAARAAALHTH